MRNTQRTPLVRQLLFLAAGPLLCLALKDLAPLPGMNPNGMLCLGVCTWLLIWWITEVLPLPVTSLVAVPLFGFLGILSPDKAFALIGHPAMMLIFGATIIVGGWKESRLIERVLWCCGPQLFTWLGFTETGKMMTAAVVALFMGVATFLLPIRREASSGKLVFAMNWEQAVRNIGWGIIVLQIGAIAFGQVLLMGGVDKWMALGIQTLVGDVQGAWVWFALVLLTGFLSQIILSLAVIPLMLPITASLASTYGFDPLQACLSVGFVSNLTTMFPFSSVAVAAVIGGGEGYARAQDFVLSGLMNTVLVTAITFVFCSVVGPSILY